jgi:hypothetical protein
MAKFECQDCGEILDHSEVLTHSCSVGDDFNVPDVIGEVIAFRSWNVDLNGILLSLNGQRWRPGGYLVAECQNYMLAPGFRARRSLAQQKHKQSEIPVPTCTCGIYAAKTREHLLDMQYNRWTPGDDPYPRVIGEVALAGKIIPGSQGYRAARARPRTIYVPYEAWKYVEKIERMYPEVDVELANTLR